MVSATVISFQVKPNLQKHSADYTNSQMRTFSEIACQKCTTHGLTPQSTSNNTDDVLSWRLYAWNELQHVVV